MAKTTAELVAAAYAELTVSGQAASAEDTATITAYVAPLIDTLAKRRIITVADANAVPDSVFIYLVRLLAERAAPYFGRASNEEVARAAEADLGRLARLDRTLTSTLVKTVLERLAALDANSEAIDATAVSGAVQATLDDLAARRVASIADEAAIGSARFPHVVTLVAARVRPGAVDPAAVLAAEARLREVDRFNRAAGTELSQRVLEQLEIFGQGRNVVDSTLVEDRIPGLLAELTSLGAYAAATEDDISEEAMPSVAVYMAAALSAPPLYPVKNDAARTLRTLQGPAGERPPVRAAYF